MARRVMHVRTIERERELGQAFRLILVTNYPHGSSSIQIHHARRTFCSSIERCRERTNACLGIDKLRLDVEGETRESLSYRSIHSSIQSGKFIRVD